MEEQEETNNVNDIDYFKGWAPILDIIYGISVTYIIFLYTEAYIIKKSASFKPSIDTLNIFALIVMTIFILEDYCTVKLISNVRGYRNAFRFCIDVLIALGLFFSLQMLLAKDKNFIILYAIILALCLFWFAVLAFFEKPKIEDNYKHYFIISGISHVVYFCLILLPLIFNNLIKNFSLIKFQKLLCFFILVSAISILLMVILKARAIANLTFDNNKEEMKKKYHNLDFMYIYAGPILSSSLVAILLRIIWWYKRRKYDIKKLAGAIIFYSKPKSGDPGTTIKYYIKIQKPIAPFRINMITIHDKLKKFEYALEREKIKKGKPILIHKYKYDKATVCQPYVEIQFDKIVEPIRLEPINIIIGDPENFKT